MGPFFVRFLIFTRNLDVVVVIVVVVSGLCSECNFFHCGVVGFQPLSYNGYGLPFPLLGGGVPNPDG